MKIKASFAVLMKLAFELGKARKCGNKKEIKRTKEVHDKYRDICLKADEIDLHITNGDL